jgi:hypothetical protein
MRKEKAMQTETTTSHKGHRITTRCAGTSEDRFQASFTISAPFALSPEWQEFATSAFVSPETATADALREARTFVDDLIVGGQGPARLRG